MNDSVAEREAVEDTASEDPKGLTDLLDAIGELGDDSQKVSVDKVMDAVGHRSFGPLLLVVGVFAGAPGVGDIPGVATLLGLFVLTVSVQLLFGRDEFWLPQWLLGREISGKSLKKMTAGKWIRKLAKWTDKAVTERLSFLAGRKATYAIAVACTLMAAALPLTEFVPMATTVVSLGLVAFGLSLIARDGLMALVGFAISGVMVAVLVMGLG